MHILSTFELVMLPLLNPILLLTGREESVSKLRKILFNISDNPTYNSKEEAEQQIKSLFLGLIGDMEKRETADMSLKSWTPEDYKAFGRNELRAQLIGEVMGL